MALTRSTQNTRTRADAHTERLRLLGFAILMVLAGFGLGAAGGPPRVPTDVPRLEQLSAALSGSTLPMQPVALVLLDLAWLMWLWIAGSLAIELLVVAAEALAHGAAWAQSLRRLADRFTFPLARRAVAAAFAVQILSRGVPMAAAQPLSPAEMAYVLDSDRQSDQSAVLVAGNGSAQASRAVATYVVCHGDTLWSIADQAYGSGTVYRRLVAANLGRRMPDGQVFAAQGVIRPGWELVVPEPNLDVEEVDGQRWYTVQPGDTLSGIAAMLLGDESHWRDLFELNRGARSPDGLHVLANQNIIWPGLRLQLPDSPAPPVEVAEPATPDQVVASTPPAAPPAVVEPPIPPLEAPSPSAPLEDADPPPFARTPHPQQVIALEPTEVTTVPPEPASSPADADVSPPDAEVSQPETPRSADSPLVPVALGGLSLAALAGVGFGARRLRRLRPLPHEPESEVIVAGGFAEAQLTHDFTRGLQGIGFDPLTAIVCHVQRLLDEYNLGDVGIVSLRHGRSATTLTLSAGLAQQPILVDLAPVFGSELDAAVDARVSADQDVILRLVRLRKTRLLPAAGVLPESVCLVPLGVLYDRQVFVATSASLGHALVVSLPGHGADTILTSLVATLTARRSPERLRIWLIAHPRALPAPVFDLPHLVRSVDPSDQAALALAAEHLRAELDARTQQRPTADLVVVVPELTSLGEHAAALELLAGRAAHLGVRFIAATTCPEDALLSPLIGHFGTRLVLRMQDEEASVALLGVADAAFLGGGGRLLLRLDGREPVELYGYQVAAEHLERLVRVMRSAYPSVADSRPDPPPSSMWPPIPTGAPADQAPEEEAAPPEHLAIHAPAEVVAPPDRPAVQAPEELAAPPGPAARANPEGPPIQVFCFGGPRVLCAGQQVWPKLPGGEAKPWEFLLYLACQPADGVASEDAVEALWPEDDVARNPAHRFRQLRYRLRHLLATVEGAPETDGICLERGVLRLDPRIVCSDAQEFVELVHSARLNSGRMAIQQLARARDLFVGDLLEGPDARRYAWVDERDDTGVTLREHFRRLFQNASTRLAELYAVAGEFDASIDVYRELTDVDPGDERFWRALFRLHADRGDRLALVREERRMRDALRDLAADLDTSTTSPIDDLSPETLQEYQRLLAGLHDHDREPAAV